MYIHFIFELLLFNDKKLSTYLFITVLAIIIGYILAITFNNLLKTYKKVKENNKKVNFLEKIN